MESNEAPENRGGTFLDCSHRTFRGVGLLLQTTGLVETALPVSDVVLLANMYFVNFDYPGRLLDEALIFLYSKMNLL